MCIQIKSKPATFLIRKMHAQNMCEAPKKCVFKAGNLLFILLS